MTRTSIDVFREHLTKAIAGEPLPGRNDPELLTLIAAIKEILRPAHGDLQQRDAVLFDVGLVALRALNAHLKSSLIAERELLMLGADNSRIC
jgi:hypothetical protein